MKNLSFRFRKVIPLLWETFISNEVDSKLIKRGISSYFYGEYDQSTISFFTNIRVLEYNHKFVVEITTHRPRLLIGKGGRTVDDLKDFLNKGDLPKKVEIDIKESKMWSNLY
jgi:ribosomal protein S3